MEVMPHDYELRFIGAIQSFGCIVAVKYITVESVFRIIGYSKNFIEKSWYTIKCTESILGNTLSEVFDNDAAKCFNLLLLRFHINLLYGKKASVQNEFETRKLSRDSYILLGGNMVCCSIVDTSEPCVYVLELEQVDNLEQSLLLKQRESDGLSTMDSFCYDESSTLSNLLEKFLRFMLSIVPNYDRGLVYQFNADESGEVICEEIKNQSLKSSYKHLRFPAEDIPIVARRLYKMNIVRYIHDVSSSDSPVISLSDHVIDLSMCTTRAVSNCHKNYLRNMGVKSSLSVAIIVDEALWGLFSLHTYQNCTRPSPEERNILEMCGTTVSAEIRRFFEDQAQRKKEQLKKLLLAFQGFPNAQEFILAYSDQILQIVDADSLIIYDGMNVVSIGDQSLTLTEDGLIELQELSTNNLPLAISDFTRGLHDGAGVLFYKDQSMCFCFVRKSKFATVNWGRKADPITASDVSARLHPLGSFETCIEEYHKESKPWSKVDIELVRTFFDQVVHHLHGEAITSLRSSLDHANEECVKAVNAAREHDEFFAHMSHELRTPFHGVMSSIQLLKSSHNKISSKERMELINSALECGKLMLQTLDDILTIAKNRNVVELTKKPFKICHIFDTSYKMMLPIAELKSISLVREFGALQTHSQVYNLVRFRRIMAVGDATRLEQICNNLVNNALKFTCNGGTVIKKVHLVPSLEDVDLIWQSCKERYDCSFMCVVSPLQGKSLDASTAWLVNEVRDTGCGVDAQLLPVMFDPYRQLESDGVSKLYQGTGLGLHICRMHIELMKGCIAVASTLGKGTTILWAVPIQILDELSVASPRRSDSESPQLLERSGHSDIQVQSKESIFLLVDDSTVNLRLTKKRLQLLVGNDATILTSSNGLEAVTAYQDLMMEGKRHLLKSILMDYHMPVCSGPEAIREIRDIEREHLLTAVHIIAFTADMSETSQRILLDAGANEVLPKPTPTGQLEKCIKEVLSRPNYIEF